MSQPTYGTNDPLADLAKSDPDKLMEKCREMFTFIWRVAESVPVKEKFPGIHEDADRIIRDIL